MWKADKFAWTVATIGLSVSGCSAASQAAKKYENAKAAGASHKDLCDRANTAAQAYLDAGDKPKADEWSNTASAA